MTANDSIFVHPAALVETSSVGTGTRVWAFAHVQQGATVGANCNIGDHCFIEAGAVIGDNVTLKNNVCVWQGVRIHEGVFVGPNVAFTNDRFPRSPRLPHVADRYTTTATWLLTTEVDVGCTIGANATILPGIRLGRFAMIGAGAVVTADVPDHVLVTGSPARPQGTVCSCGRPLRTEVPGRAVAVCPHCHATVETGGDSYKDH